MYSSRNKILYLVVVVLMLAMALANAATVAAQEPTCTTKGIPSVSTAQSDYVPSSSVGVSGSGFQCGVTLTVSVTWPDGIAYTGDGTSTPGSDSVTTNEFGEFSYNHIVTMEGEYTVGVSAQDGTLLATTTFTDAITPPVSLGGYYIDDGFPADKHYPWCDGYRHSL